MTLSTRYRKPRPVWLKALGDSLLLTLGGGGACVSAFTEHPVVGAAITGLGLLGHLMTNFYNTYDKELERLENMELTIEKTTTVQQTTTVTAENKP